MCYLNERQIGEAEDGKHPAAEFIIEGVSPTDPAVKYTRKISDYYRAGVKVVWMIYPEEEQVYLHVHYSSSYATICQGDMICSAAPVLPEFALPAKEVFKKLKK